MKRIYFAICLTIAFIPAATPLVLSLAPVTTPQETIRVKPDCRKIDGVEYCLIRADHFDALLADYRRLRDNCGAKHLQAPAAYTKHEKP